MRVIEVWELRDIPAWHEGWGKGGNLGKWAYITRLTTLAIVIRCLTCRGNGRSGVQPLGRSFGDLGCFPGEVTEKLYISKIER